MKYRSLALTLILFSGLVLHSQSFEEIYSNLSLTFGIDPNSGTNSFLILNVPSGGKYEGMATAYTAVAGDIGYVNSNPAGSSLLYNTELSLLHNNWIGDVNVENIIYASRYGNLGIGFSGKIMYVDFTELDDWGYRSFNTNDEGDITSFSAGYYFETIGTVNFSYNFFRNYYFDGISLGGSFKAGYRYVPYTIDPNQNAVALMGDVGLITRFNFLKPYFSRDKNFSLGVALKNVGVEFIENPDPLPTMFSAGLAYSPFRPLTVAFDFNLPISLDPDIPAESFYFATGIDLNLTSFLSFQSGVLFKSGLPRFTIGTEIELEKVDFVVNYTLDLTTQFDEFDRISIEIRFNFGDDGRTERELEADSLYVEGLKLYAEGDFSEAIKKWELCLELNSGFTPAKEMINTAQNSLYLQTQMLENQSTE